MAREEDEALQAHMEELDSTEIITVIRRPGEDVDVDVHGTDADSAIAMLVKALFLVTLDEVGYWDGDEEEVDEEDDDSGAE